jgi:hypothetical protein
MGDKRTGFYRIRNCVVTQLNGIAFMSVLVRFSPPSMTAAQYDAIVARLYEEGVHPAPGLELEVCFGSGEQMKVSVLFDSQEHLNAFGARLAPILEEMEMDPGELEVIEVHNIIRRGA